MFNRKFVTETRLINTKKEGPTSLTVAHAAPQPLWIEKITQEQLKQGLIGLVAAYASVKVINTVCTIAINIAPKN